MHDKNGKKNIKKYISFAILLIEVSLVASLVEQIFMYTIDFFFLCVDPI